MPRRSRKTTDPVDGPPTKKAKVAESTAAATRSRRNPQSSASATPSSTKAVAQSSEANSSPLESRSSEPKSKSKSSKVSPGGAKPAKARHGTKATKPARSKRADHADEARDGSSAASLHAEDTSPKADADQREEEHRGQRSYWLMKAEPESRMEKGVDVKFSIDDLAASTEPEAWDGVRNYVARNNMRSMRKGDFAFFYHSNCKTPGIVGVMEIVQEHSPDETALDPKHPYYDPKETKENPKWSVVHVEHRLKFDSIVSLKELQQFAKEDAVLQDMQVLKMSRLSVSKVTEAEWNFVLDKAGIDPSSL